MRNFLGMMIWLSTIPACMACAYAADKTGNYGWFVLSLVLLCGAMVLAWQVASAITGTP